MNRTTTTFTLIRHGETDWNRVKRIQGHTDIPLSVEGERQAARLGERIARDVAAHGRVFDHVLTSDLRRAVQTAEPVARACGLPLVRTANLRERHYGVFETRVPDEIEAEFPQDYARWQSRDPDFTIPGGESTRAFYTRITEFVSQLLRDYAGQHLALVAHGGVLDCCYRFATGLPLSEPRSYPLLNASVNRLACDGERWQVLSWADVSHLDHAVRDESNDKPRAAEGAAQANAAAVTDRVDPRVV
ncbi:histidine phosphatase family protein [Pandoraea nosoerga]|uniref:Phosphoserine phosphatase 1 n=1 Tax=Pandoraea nosoerga TaxID=2508296 RepID=A0A5E4R7H8_9BURK|nr:histidine phosphatase family protein [Pandoraea nosoerga]MBN4668030.1 histidine phosphatase family protein [Pandoraea nosoerga]MBN4677731.1 histidine phosphatase family protein [Pandoraea nosoerga]MBN4682741.1 histidine phosphatase family protein [Pandoraea nosoerga]MBN4746563.1 histidine phosphatase family protein [Pandoraea nosoerga]VVD59296.1 Phosphoserine phosphatase 1 [Pandoraea nosoerga]